MTEHGRQTTAFLIVCHKVNHRGCKIPEDDTPVTVACECAAKVGNGYDCNFIPRIDCVQFYFECLQNIMRSSGCYYRGARAIELTSYRNVYHYMQANMLRKSHLPNVCLRATPVLYLECVVDEGHFV